ncbi:dihydrofolate reductase family protein [Nocardiopsis sp. CNT-189]|uniref:dihydrofolate reductase family protein n=1 Tax=Nocardiopsis oceanisediminis TaxID=2816862 RepID=UPI003B2A3C1A
MKLTAHVFVSLDGVMQGPGGPDEDPGGGFDRGGWLVPYVDGDFGRIVDGWFDRADGILLGRSTYDMMRAYWSRVTDPGDKVAAALNGLPKHLVSTTVTEPGWQNTAGVISSGVPEAVAALKERPGRELQVHGSRRLLHTLHDAGLVDEYRLLVCPVVLGFGKRLFAEGAAVSAYTLVHSEATGAGMVYQVLRPAPFGTGDIEVEDGREAVRLPE